MFTGKQPRTVQGKTDENGVEQHTGSGQGGAAATDHLPANMSRNGCVHGPAGMAKHGMAAGEKNAADMASGSSK